MPFLCRRSLIDRCSSHGRGFGFWRSFCSCFYSPLSLASSRVLSYFLCVPFVVLLPIFVFSPTFTLSSTIIGFYCFHLNSLFCVRFFWRGGGMQFELFLESCGLHFGFHFKKQCVNTNPLNSKSII